MHKLTALSLTLSVGAYSLADQLVVPNGYEAVDGGSGYWWFNGGSHADQSLIHASQLREMVGQTITGFAMRKGGSEESWPPGNIVVSDMRVYMAKGVPPEDMSLHLFSDNVDGSKTLVRSGSLSIPMDSYPAPSALTFGPTISFTTPYVYNGGHLLIETRRSSTMDGNMDGVSAMSGPGYGTLFSSCYATSSSAPAPISQSNFTINRLTSSFAATKKITGQIQLRDYIGDVTAVPIDIEIRLPFALTPLYEFSVLLSSNGGFIVHVPSSLANGTYNLFANGSPFVRRRRSFTLAGSQVSGVNLSLPNGDVNDSTEVDAADIDEVIAAFGATGNIVGDVDGSLEVDAADIDIVIANFGEDDD